MSTPAGIVAEHPLQALNTLRLPCVAEYFAPVVSLAELQQCLALARDRGWPVTVLGGGSNVVLPERMEGLVIANRIAGRELLSGAGAEAVLRVGAGGNWHELVRFTLAQGWCGLENLSLIPGNAGAAPIQNIGAYGVELAEQFVELDACRVTDGAVRTFSLRDCEFGYRDSVFKRDCRDAYVIVSITLRLGTGDRVKTDYAELARELEQAGLEKPTPLQVSDAVIRIRSRKLPDPAEIGNAGSFFKNPVISEAHFLRLQESEPGIVGHRQPSGEYKVAAGWLIDRAGWKGHRDGAVGVHDRQALVLVHDGTGAAHDLLRLAAAVRADISMRFGIELEIEPRVYA